MQQHARCVRIGVSAVAAVQTLEVALSTVFGCHEPTFRTRLRRVGCRHEHDLASVASGLVRAEGAQPVRSHIQNRPVEPCLLLDVGAWLFDGALRRGCHVLHPQLFEHQDAVVLGVVLGDAVSEVFSLAAQLLVRLRQPGAGLGPVV
jgi:hypothetical protein